MKNSLLIGIGCLLLTLHTGCYLPVNMSVSEPDAKLTVDGKPYGNGNGQATLMIKPNNCHHIKVEKIGYVTEEVTYCAQKGAPRPPSKKYFNLQKDEAYDASVKTDKANIAFSIQVNKKLTEADAWKIVAQVVGNYIDDIQSSDMQTGYLKTAWAVQSFNANTVRTRIIVMSSSSNPLAYRLKLVSECSGQPGTSVKDDDKFKEWDRVLRKYENIISEFQTRLGVK